MPPRVKFTEAEHKVLIDNCMLRPLQHIADDLGKSYRACKKYLNSIGVVIPSEIIRHFSLCHTPIGTPRKGNKNRYVKKGYPKSRAKHRVKSAPIRVLPKDMRKVAEPAKLPTKQVDYSTKRMVKVDNKTWRYVDK